MSPEAQRITIAQACGWKPLFVLMKRGLFYRPNGHGYTSCEAEAWKLEEAEADKYVYAYDEPVTKQLASIPDYLNDLNAMHEAERWIFNKCQWLTYTDLIIEIQPKDESPIKATATQRAEAFLRTLGLWKEE